jgi:hypothetical protein
MALFQQNSPTSPRSAASTSRETRGIVALDSHPYLITNQGRKSAPSTQATQRYLALFPYESEDARLTGATRSLNRRLLALNLPTAAAAAPQISVATVETVSPVFVGSVKPSVVTKVSSRIA